MREYLREWIEAKATSVRPGTLSTYRRDVEAHLVPALGRLLLTDLTPARLSSWYGQLLTAGRVDGKGGLAPKTVRNLHGTLHLALADAVRWGLVSRNVAEQATLPRAQRSEMQVWNPDQIRTFLDFSNDHPLVIGWLLSALTGMRRGEVLGLRWSDVDLDNGRLSISQTLTIVDSRIGLGEPKTRAGRRVIALDETTCTALRQHRARQAEQRLLLGPAWKENGLVTTREDGRPVHPQYFSRCFSKQVTKAGLRQIRLHDLRHSWATAALGAGVPAKVVSERLGHSAIGITLDVYSHVLPQMDRDAADRVADAIFG